MLHAVCPFDKAMSQNGMSLRYSTMRLNQRIIITSTFQRILTVFLYETKIVIMKRNRGAATGIYRQIIHQERERERNLLTLNLIIKPDILSTRTKKGNKSFSGSICIKLTKALSSLSSFVKCMFALNVNDV